MAHILQEMGAGVRFINNTTLEIDPRTVGTYVAPYELVRQMRASYYLLGALLGRYPPRSGGYAWRLQFWGAPH